MDEQDSVNLFISEGAGVSEIVAAMEAAGEDVPRDPFGHVQLDKINPGQWFAKQFAAELGADKVLVQKSGYFARSAAANEADLELIRQCTTYAVDAALRGESGVVGQDEERGDRASGDRVRADCGRQDVRRVGAVVRTPDARARPRLTGGYGGAANARFIIALADYYRDVICFRIGFFGTEVRRG